MLQRGRRIILMSYQKSKKYKLNLIVCSIIVLICAYGVYYVYQDKNDFEKQYFQLVDIEDLHNQSYTSNLYNQPDLLTRLEKFNEELKNNNNFIFIEFASVNLQFIGKWDKPVDLVENTTTIDQVVTVNNKEILTTSVEGIVLDQTSLELYSLDISSGELFSNDDFIQNNNEFPLVLGSDFEDYYSIGDTIPLFYYGEEWKGIVKGFLKENEQIKQDSMVYNLDNHVLVPSFESTMLVTGFDENYQKRMYHSKIQGYLILDSKAEYQKAKREIKELSNKYNLSYQLLKGY